MSDRRGRARGDGTDARILPGVILFLLALGGRYSLDRAGFGGLAFVDLRMLGLPICLALLLLDVARRGGQSHERRPEGWLAAILIFFLYQVASGLWAPPGSRVGAYALDLGLMAFLTVGGYVYARVDPKWVARRLLALLYLAALVYALAALVGGPDAEQGRYAALGGGPNVFVRVEVLGTVSAVILAALTKRPYLVFPVPLLLVLAVLSGSRGGLLAAVVVSLICLVIYWRRIPKGRLGRLLILVTLALAAIWQLAPASVTDFVRMRFVVETLQQGYVTGRNDIWRDSLGIALAHPLVGAGLDGYYGLIGSSRMVQYPHDYVLAVAAEGGAVGLVLLGLSIAMLARTFRSGNGQPAEVQILLILAAYVAVASLFSGDYYDARMAWMFAAIAVAGARPPSRRSRLLQSDLPLGSQLDRNEGGPAKILSDVRGSGD